MCKVCNRKSNDVSLPKPDVNSLVSSESCKAGSECSSKSLNSLTFQIPCVFLGSKHSQSN